MSDLYRDIVLDHWRNPRYADLLEGATHTATVANEQCGDSAAVALGVSDGQITAVSVQVDGCALATAAGSVLAESLLNTPIDQVVALTEADIRKLFGGIDAVPARRRCLTLALEAVQLALLG